MSSVDFKILQERSEDFLMEAWDFVQDALWEDRNNKGCEATVGKHAFNALQKAQSSSELLLKSFLAKKDPEIVIKRNKDGKIKTLNVKEISKEIRRLELLGKNEKFLNSFEMYAETRNDFMHSAIPLTNILSNIILYIFEVNDLLGCSWLLRRTRYIQRKVDQGSHDFYVQNFSLSSEMINILKFIDNHVAERLFGFNKETVFLPCPYCDDLKFKSIVVRRNKCICIECLKIFDFTQHKCPSKICDGLNGILLDDGQKLCCKCHKNEMQNYLEGCDNSVAIERRDIMTYGDNKFLKTSLRHSEYITIQDKNGAIHDSWKVPIDCSNKYNYL
jgi:hypothetical protein